MWFKGTKQQAVKRAQTLLGSLSSVTASGCAVSAVPGSVTSFGAAAQNGSPQAATGATFSCLSFLAMNCQQAGLPEKAWHQIGIRLIIALLLGVALSILFQVLLFLALPLVWIFLEYLSLQRRIFSRAEHFERDYPPFLIALASSVRTGLDPLDALLGTTALFPKNAVLSKEIEKSRQLVDGGAQEVEIINSFAATIRHPDLPLFRTAFILSRQQGTSLAECLHRLAKVTRQRQSFRRKIKAAVALQKLSAIGIGLCTIVIVIIQCLSNPAALETALSHPTGQRLLSLGMLLVLAGLFWVFNLARPRI